jgi:uncharacterized protein (DUF1501 family)
MLSRRAFLKSSGLALFGLSVGGSPAFLQRAAAAAARPGPHARRKVLVSVFLRGAMDGVMAVAPFRDPHLARLRPRLAMSAARSAGDDALIDLDGTFGLHPALAPLERHFRDKRLAVVHGMGSPVATRSHFDAQDYMELGTPGQKSGGSGWLNRATGLLGHEAPEASEHEATPFQAVALTPSMPLSLYGDAPALAVADLRDLALAERAPGGGARLSAAGGLEALYDQAAQSVLRDAGREAFEATRVVEAVRQNRGARTSADANYPAAPLGQSLRQVAQLVKAGVGLEVAFVEQGGWDTHVRQGTTGGTFARNARTLAQSLDAFWTDLGPAYHDDVVVLTMTEFGRTIRENGALGTDHGRASCAFVMGAGVAGGRVYGAVPALAPDNLADGRDLPVTTDFRAVFSAVAGQHLGVTDTAALFPGWGGKARVALFR